MQDVLNTTHVGSRLGGSGNDPVALEVAVERVGMRFVRLPLKEAFETSFGRIHSRLIFLVWIEGNGLTGRGEVVAPEEPRYSSETHRTAAHVIREYPPHASMDHTVPGLIDPAA